MSGTATTADLQFPVFVYGTLKSGGSNHSLIEHLTFLGKAITVDPYPLVVGSYPFLLDEKGKGHCVTGELYQLTKLASLEKLDRLEDHPRMYERRLREVVLSSGATIQCWIYFLNQWNENLSNSEMIQNFDVTKINYK